MRACPVRQNAGGRGAQLPGGAGGTEARHPDRGDGCTAPARVLTGCRPPRKRQLSCGLGLQEAFHFPSEHSPTPRSERGPSSPAELPPPARPVSQRTARAPPGSADWGTAASPHTPQPGPGSPRPRHPDATPLLTELVTQWPPGQDKPPSAQAPDEHQARARRASGHSVHPGSSGKPSGRRLLLPTPEGAEKQGEKATVSGIKELIKSAGLTDPVSEPGRGAEN